MLGQIKIKDFMSVCVRLVVIGLGTWVIKNVGMRPCDLTCFLFNESAAKTFAEVSIDGVSDPSYTIDNIKGR